MKRSLALFCVILPAGCTVGPNYARPPAAVPSQFAEPNTAATISDAELASWWRVFNDPQLDVLVNHALAQNLDVETAAARIREARAQERVAGAAGQPQIDFKPSVTRQRISENAIPIPPGSNPNQGAGFGFPGAEFSTFRVGFDASWEIDLFGHTKRSVEAARARTEGAVWNRRDLQVSVAAEVAQNYLQLRTLQQRIANAAAELQRQQRAEQLVAARRRGGLVTGQDLEQQRSERSTAAAAIPALEAEAEAHIHALGVLTGTVPEALRSELAQPAAVPAAPPLIPVGLPSDLLRRRADIRMAERELAASTADIGVAVADLYPRFSLTAAPALVSTTLGKLLDWGSRSYSFGANADWPLFDAGRRRANIDVANARQDQALIAYRKSVLAALQDVEDALSRNDADRAQLRDLEEALGTAARAEDIARTRFRGGLVTYSDVLLAQQKRLKLEEQLIETRGALARDTVALFKALGGGWPDVGAAS